MFLYEASFYKGARKRGEVKRTMRKMFYRLSHGILSTEKWWDGIK
jgi:hypothetical protein